VREKEKAWQMHALYWLGFMWIWNREFFPRYATAAIHIYVPAAWWRTEDGWKTLAHEIVHIDRNKARPVWTFLRYGSPQLLALLGLLGFLGLAWWPFYFLFALVPFFIAPIIPSTGRIDEELHAYAMSVACDNLVFREHGIVVRESTAIGRVDSLLTAGYFWPAGPWKKRIRDGLIADLDQRAALVSVTTSDIYRTIVQVREQ